MSLNSSWIEKNMKKTCRGNQNTQFISNTFIVSENSAVCEIITKSTGRAGKDIDEFHFNYTDCKT